ncbi:unnamed protein product [Cyprideis torosa]|uniref:Uncharacterized protein n=1 Tax=Cyprideis torosa TaxID=163714 RepID=A0A7R8W1H7_9CRUS|nr:unnamed protein product [Cyprideis torosa]CAG0880758.1 unnamed protein product [Cyprideis torosa]
MSSRALRKLERSQKEEVGNELENDSDEPNSLLDHSIGNGPGFSFAMASEVFRMAEDYESCREMVHRALFACESAFHPRFSLTAGTSRLNYKYAVNRPFFLALFRHAMFLGQRACYRTALEVTKVTLSFDLASDPLALTLLLDHFALRADEDKWLVDFIDTFEPQRNLTLLPNMAFSRALALFKCGQKDEADRALETALRRFPGVLIPLIEACGASPVTAVSEHPDFCLASRAKEPKSLQALQDLYISRTSPGWKVPGVMAWLEQVVERLCQDKTPSRTVEEIESFHKRFLYMPRNVKRHLVLCDASISAALIGNQESQIHSYDPLPPPDSIAPYDRPSRRRATDSDSFVSGLLRSLLPGFNPNEVQERLQEAEARRGVVAEAQVVLERLREMILQFGQETAAQEPHLPDELD